MKIALSIILCLIAVCDLRERRIPNRLLSIMFLCSLLTIWIEAMNERSSATGIAAIHSFAPLDRLMGALLVSLFMILVIRLRPGAFGYGDVKLMALSGLVLRCECNLIAFACGILLAGAYCIIGLLLRKIDRKSKIAFGPFLATGIILILWFGDQITEWL